MENTGTWPHAAADDGFAERLLGGGAQSFVLGTLRTLSGAALSCVFGFACSLGEFGHASPTRMLAVAAPTLVFGIGFVPALWVLLTLFGRNVDVERLASAATRTSAVVGLSLAGLAPAAALFELTAGGSGGAILATLLEVAGAFVAGLLGARAFQREALASLPLEQREGMAALLVAAFAFLGLLLGARLVVPALFGSGF